MPIDDSTLASGMWCSRREVCDVISELPSAIGDDEELLDRAISMATSDAKAMLRSRWPNVWPFNTPPEEIRGPVAVMAAYRAVRSRALSGGAMEILETLRLDNNRAEAKLDRIADSQAHPELSDVTGIQAAAVAAAPKGEFGFKKRT